MCKHRSCQDPFYDILRTREYVIFETLTKPWKTTKPGKTKPGKTKPGKKWTKPGKRLRPLLQLLHDVLYWKC
uniref:Uncharacterized protein n=1 Tax=Caenorhabditis japonica TaxID=281687 RepID=A0A8R1EPA2_CAEJA